MRDNGAKMCYLFLSGEHDGKWQPVNIWEDGTFMGEIDQHKLDVMHDRCKYIRREGLDIVFWLASDDSSNYSAQPVSKWIEFVDLAVDEFDKYACGYVAALEANEHFSSKWAAVADRLQQKTDKPIGIHETSGQYSYAKHGAIDIMYFQFGWNKSPAQIAATTRNVINALGGKPVIACEYNMSSDTNQARAQGDGGIAGGASGSGNGRN